jgi:hypothetical protein
VFFFSGRRIVIVRVNSSSVTMMCSVMAGPLQEARDEPLAMRGRSLP